MKITQLAVKPALIKITLDEADIVESCGEPVEFWSFDRQPLDVFMKLAAADHTKSAEMIDIVRTLILDEEGKQVITGDKMLPTNVLIAAIAKLVEKLGN